MLEFYFIADEQPNSISNSQLNYAGGIEEEEFEMAQKVGLIESQADYYGKFRWSSGQVKNKIALLANCPFRANTDLDNILKQAKATDSGLLAFGD